MAKNNWISTTSEDYSVAGNWSDGVPNAADEVALENSNINIAAGLDQSAVALTSFIQYSSYTGKIGLHNLSATPGIAGTYLQIDTPLLVLGRIPFPGAKFQGSQRVMIDLGSALACTVRVESTCDYSSEANWGLPPVRLKGVDIAHTLEVWDGSVGVACGRSDEVSTFGTVTCGRVGNGRARLFLGQGVTINTKVDVISGIALLHNAYPSANLYGGRTIHNGAGAVSGTITIHPGATLIWNSTGTANAIVVKNGGRLDLTQSSQARTITTLTYDSPEDIGENNAVTITNRVPTGKGGGGGGYGTGGGYGH